MNKIKEWLKQWLYGDKLYEIPVQTIYYDDVDRLIFKFPEAQNAEDIENFSRDLKRALKDNRAIVTTRNITVFHLKKNEVPNDNRKTNNEIS